MSFLMHNEMEVKGCLMGRPSVGGAFIVNKQRYLKGGGENENFYGWGQKMLNVLKEWRF